MSYEQPEGQDTVCHLDQMHSTGGSDAMETATSNDLILKCILSHFRTLHLVRDCRLVCKQWKRIATEILKKRTDAFIQVNLTTDFKSLEDCIKDSSDFPFRQIHLECDRNDFEKSISKWLGLQLFHHYGSLFTSLQLAACRVHDDVVTDLLAGPFNHIAALTLHRIQRKKRSERFKALITENGTPLKLEKLKSIALGHDTGCDGVNLTFLKALLRACTNLERAENFTNAHLATLSNADKLGTVKSLRVCCCFAGDELKIWPSGIEKLTLSDVKHEDEDPDTEGARFVLKFAQLKPLLESSRDSLRHIEARCEVLGGRNCDDWPKLTKLTSLTLMECFEFPASVNTIFPALETVRLGLIGADTGSSYDYYIWREPLESVTKLEVFRWMGLDDWMTVSYSAPNVRHIFLDFESQLNRPSFISCYYAEDEEVVVDPWKSLSLFEQLETLTITPIELPGTNLDEFFTGITGPCLKKLRANPRFPIPAAEFIDGVLRERGGVTSLPAGLKELVLCFNMADEVTREDLQEKCSISHVAVQYGLNLLSADLKIRFLYDHWTKNARLIRKVLRPARDRVTYDHLDAHL